MSVSKPHSVQDDFATIRRALTFDEGTIVERRHTNGHAALTRIEEQLETLQQENRLLGATVVEQAQVSLVARELVDNMWLVTTDNGEGRHEQVTGSGLEYLKRKLQELDALLPKVGA